MEVVATVLLLLAGLALLLYLAAAAALFFRQGSIVFVPSRQLWRTPADAGLPYEEIFLRAADGVRLHGWWVPSPDERRGTVLFLHGNAGNISDRIDTLEMLHGWGFDSLIVDYRGYGKSEGRPSEKGTYRDADAAWRFLIDEKEVNPAEVILFGRSLGAAVAAYLASRVQPGGVVLESGFSSLPDLAATFYRHFPVRLLARSRYPTIERVGRIRAPVLVAHSAEDDLIPFSHAERIFAAAQEPKFFLEMVGTHGDCVSATGVSYERAVRGFLVEALAIPPADALPRSEGLRGESPG